MTDRTQTIRHLLEEAFVPTELLVKDQSHLHAGHAGAREGKGHFDVRIVSDKFTGLNRIQRHRMVYDSLGSFMQSDVHALRVNAISPQDHLDRS
jgi:BolA protein